MKDRQTDTGESVIAFEYIAHMKVLVTVELLEFAQSSNQMMNLICFNKRCNFMVMRVWI